MSKSDLPRLSAAACARYRDDGFVFVPDLIPPQDIERVAGRSSTRSAGSRATRSSWRATAARCAR